MEHAKIIEKKVFLRKIYLEWYQVFLDEVSNSSQKKILELGSGGGFLKKIAPFVVTSDYLPLPTNDLTFSALDMPFENASIDAILMIDTFHHLPDAGAFLCEVDRVLKSEGRLIMIEPANSLWGRFIYQNFHHEPFDPELDWKMPSTGPLSGANGALPWIVFERDQELFKSRFPYLEIVAIKYHTPFRYLLSGGLTAKAIVPDFSFSFFKRIDSVLSNLLPSISMFMTIIIRKK